MSIQIVSSNEREQLVRSEGVFQWDANAEFFVVRCFPQHRRQTIYGFGAAMTEASASILLEMEPAQRRRFWADTYGKDGLNYKLCRIPMQSCDFSLSTYQSLEKGDVDFETFSMGNEEQFLLPMLEELCQTRTDLSVLAVPWSPPDFMKSNQSMLLGGRLKDKYYAKWAETMARYVEHLIGRGIPVTWLNVQNEPNAVQSWESCLYSANEELDFAANYLKTALRKRRIHGVKLLLWDHNKDDILGRVTRYMSSPDWDESIAGFAFHWYTGDHFAQLAAVREQNPNRDLIMTEGCTGFSLYEGKEAIFNAEFYAHQMIGNLNAGANAHVDWNMVLDQHGGPNHVGNFCDAPCIYHRDEKSMTHRLSYYYIYHFSHFVQPGAKRMLTSSYHHDLECVGFVNPDGTRVLILLNRSDRSIAYRLMEDEHRYKADVAAHSIVTLLWDAPSALQETKGKILSGIQKLWRSV